MSFTELTAEEKTILLDIARESINYGLKHGKPIPVTAADYSNTLQQDAATFVTLNLNNQLRGCIGTLEAYQPLIKDVADHAFAAAFHDSRFPPLTAAESIHLDIHISILTPSTPMSFISEEDLIRQIQPGVDGLILEDGFHKGTFLPSVWEGLSTAKEFLQHLKLKAGLGKNYWSENIKVSRYRTVSVP
ncbi:MAG TPA: AmmeMemoRadiSam system protein A [Gammaproteobacteria bacterium]